MRQQNRVGMDCGGFGLGLEAGIRMPLIPHGHRVFEVETRSQHVEFDRNWGLDKPLKAVSPTFLMLLKREPHPHFSFVLVLSE